MISALTAVIALASFLDAPSFEVIANYPATLVHALDAAAGMPHHGSGYREWLLGAGAPDPEWLRAYRERRPTWTANRDDGDGPYEPYSRASHDTTSVDELVARIGSVLSGDDLAVAKTAIAAADKLLAPRWPEISRKLLELGGEMSALLTGEKGVALTKRLRAATRLAPETPLRFRIILIAKPKGSETSASTQADHLVMEVPPDTTATRHVGIAFHEMTHFAARRSPVRQAMEDAFLALGDDGLIAANYWDEAFATAFGNGIAAAELDPRLDASGPMYAVPAIDALGRALHSKWVNGADVALGPAFAPLLVDVVKSAWPRERRTLRDVFLRCEALTDDRSIVQTLAQRLTPSSLSAQIPVPATLERPPRPPEKVPRIVFLAKDALADKVDVLKVIGVYRGDAESHSEPASLYWTKDRDGVPLVLVIARDADALRAAAQALDPSTRIPPPGWSALGSLR